MRSRKLYLILSLAACLASIAAPGALGRATAQAAGASQPDTPSESNAQSVAKLFGLDEDLTKLRQMQAARAAGSPVTFEEVVQRQQLMAKIQSAFADVDSVVVELSNEQSDLGTVKAELQQQRDKKVGKLTTAALLTGSGIGVAVSATQFTTLSSSTQNTGDAIGIGSGVASTVLSILAARAQNGSSASVGQTPNMLAPLLPPLPEDKSGEKPALNTAYPAPVLAFLNSVPAGQDPGAGTRLERLMASWDKAGRLSGSGSGKRDSQIAKLTASGDDSVKLSIADLTDRIAMLGDVRSRVSLIKRDLATLLRQGWQAGAGAPQGN